MIREATDCIDAGSEYCPCKLAEAGECILCSQMHGKCFCDCLNWKGVCIYQEFYNNGMKSKGQRKKYNLEVKEIIKDEEKFLIFKFKSTHKLCLDLINPGSYIFLCPEGDNRYFDTPISILESDPENNILTVCIEIRGIKTKKLLDYKSGDTMTIRGPYWNGVFGLKNIEKQKNVDCLVVGRGIGVAPMVPVIRKLTLNNCNVDVLVDYSGMGERLVDSYINKYLVNVNDMNLLNKGELSEEFKVCIKNKVEKGVRYIHIAGADILTLKVIEYLDSILANDVLLSCCNNFKMCCGEGICGACTARYKGHKVKRYCKVQTDPRSIFEERRLI